MKFDYLAIFAIVLIFLGGAFIYFNSRQKFDKNIVSEQQKVSYPLRLQAYERMILFLERIKPQSLLTRINLENLSPAELQQVILSEIKAEFNHNTAQQLYISKDTWAKISAAASQTSAWLIHGINQRSSLIDAKSIVVSMLQSQDDTPTLIIEDAINAIKDEAQQNF